jgi:hypothetical protein
MYFRNMNKILKDFKNVSKKKIYIYKKYIHIYIYIYIYIYIFINIYIYIYKMGVYEMVYTL